MDPDPMTRNSFFETSGLELMEYAVLFEKTATGFSAHVPDLRGCVAAGATKEETAELMRKAIQMHLAGMREDGDPIPEPSTIAEYITAA
jgi:predicted RNase H-like HicB family nuclease